MSLGQEYLKVVQERFRSVKDLGDKTIAQLSESELRFRTSEASNSIALIVKHMSGNMVSRWTDFLTTDGEKPTRKRDEEFEDTLTTKADVLACWEQGWKVLLDTLSQLREADLLATVYIRSEPHTVMEAIERQVAHYGYHVGQIVWIGKQIKGDSWHTLSIAKGESAAYLEQKQNEHRS
ncbi:DUF1572 family protein [Marinicrinis sediminis]|uniref:DUF1572 family protein n=1 Tax=Marinicrinis sediminis TaxID=1652465 RepID=A0ABW5RH49_9BACL